MKYSDDFRWRAVALLHVYNVPVVHMSELLEPRLRPIRRWYALFLSDELKQKHTKWSQEVLEFVAAYVDGHPTFYLEELQDTIITRFPLLKTVCTSTICRALNFDLNLSPKVLSKAAREAVPAEIRTYKEKLLTLYSYAGN
ncbi:Transposase [Phytophthora megakarya]|uniref:Transposase n=1 Tax=Phytophthora megakarya TaxID=4795 RepID=A0A225X1M9_9STRA|nr:Transposase [Phytophthora megakarya]